MLCLDEGKRARLGRPAMTPYVLRLASALWETSSVLLIEGDEAVAVDPGITQSEIEGVRDRADAEGARVVAVLATHADFDHIAGIATFPEAEAAMGPRAAARIASGDALREVVEEGRPLGLSWPGEPRCDRILRVGRRELIGPFAVETMELAGHTDCGVGYRLRIPDVLIVGDYLSPYRVPVRLPLDGRVPEHARGARRPPPQRSSRARRSRARCAARTGGRPRDRRAGPRIPPRASQRRRAPDRGGSRP